MSHLLLLYVTLEQENVIRSLFDQKEWSQMKIDIEALQSNQLNPGDLPHVGQALEVVNHLRSFSTEEGTGISAVAEVGARTELLNGNHTSTTLGQQSSRLKRVVRSTNKTGGACKSIINKERPNSPRHKSTRGRRLPGCKAENKSKLQFPGKINTASKLPELSEDERKLPEIDKGERKLPDIDKSENSLPVTDEDKFGQSLICDTSLVVEEKLEHVKNLEKPKIASLQQGPFQQERLDIYSDDAKSRLSVNDDDTCTVNVNPDQVTESHITENLTDLGLYDTHKTTHYETACIINDGNHDEAKDLNKDQDGCDGSVSNSEDNSKFTTQCRTSLKMKIKNGKLASLEKKRKQSCVQKDQADSMNEALQKPHSNCQADLSVTKFVEKSGHLDVSSKKKKGKKRPVYCNDCKTMFTSKRRYDSHKEKNGGQCVFKCEYCGKIFLYRKSKYLIHIRSAHTKERPFSCDICYKGYVTSDKLKIHKRTHTGEKPCICEQCGKSFYSRADLSIHRDYHHTSRQNPDDFVCSQCNLTFCSKRYLVYHQTVTHSDRRDFKCTKCEKGFKCNTALQRHLKYIHSESRDFKCDKCNKAFKSPNCLRKHVLRHGEEKGFYCSYCNKGFYERAKLLQHLRIHTGEKPFKCDLCDYRCALSGNLSKHRKTHFKSL